MQHQSRFDRLARGEERLFPEELPAFVGHCLTAPQLIVPAATALYRHDPPSALTFLQQVTAEANDLKPGRISPVASAAIHACHSALALTSALRNPNPSAQLQGDAMQSALKAETDRSGACGLSRALVHLYRGELAECLKLAKSLEEALNRHPKKDNQQLTITQLVLAQCCFAKKTYDQALEYFRKIFIRNNWLPIQGRMGMGYCYYHLGKYEMAGACATRVLQLQPRSVDAHILLALVCHLGEDHQGYFNHLTTAYQLDPQQPLLLYLVANHLFLRDKLQQAEQLCRKAQNNLQGWSQWLHHKDGMRDDWKQLNNRITNLLGQIFHKRKDYAGALEHYGKAGQKGLFWNDLAMVQCMLGLQRHKEGLDSLTYTYRVYEKEKRDWRLLKDSYRMMAYLKAKCRSKDGEQGKQALHFYGEAIKFDKNDVLLKEQLWYLLSSVERDNHKALRTMQELQKQQTSPNPEALLNYGVLLMHNHQPQEAEAKLRQALHLIQQWDELDCTQQKGFLLIAKYNLAICLQSANCNHAALQLIESILEANRLHINALLQKALLFHKLGNTLTAIQFLRAAESTFVQRLSTQVHINRIKTMEAYLLFLHNQPLQAFEILKGLVQKKPSCLYLKTLQFAVCWEVAARVGGQQEARTVQEARQLFEKVCGNDNTELFCCMVAGVARAWQGSLGKQQGTNLFKKILLSSSLSCLRYNMAIFYIQHKDPDAAVSCLNQHRQSPSTPQQLPALELIAHQYLVGKDYRRCLKTVKRSILMQPASMTHRLQLAIATQAKCEAEINNKNPSPSQVKQDQHQIQKCILIYRFCSTKNSIPYIQQKCIQNSAAAERILQRHNAQLRQMGEQAGRADGSESQGEEEKQRRQMEEKKKRALALSKLKAQSMNESWNMIQEKQRAAEEDKGRKRTNRDPPTPPNATPPRRRDKRDKRDQARTQPDDASTRRNKQDVPDDESLSRYMVE